MASTHVTYSARRLLSEHVVLHVHVRGLRLARLRLRCAMPLIWLAAKIAGTGFEVNPE
jgi:hypothetical protein